MIVGDQIREVGAAALQSELHLVVGQFLHLLDRGDDRLGGGFRAFLDMHVHRGDDVIGTKGLAIVELHALAKVECPDLRVRRCLPAFRQFADQLASRGYFGQGLEYAPGAHVDHEAVGMCAAVPGVRRVAARHTDGVSAAMLRRCDCRQAGNGQSARRGSRFQRGPPRNVHSHMFPPPDPSSKVRGRKLCCTNTKILGSKEQSMQAIIPVHAVAFGWWPPDFLSYVHHG